MANENVMTVLDEPIAKISYLTRLRMHDATTIRQSSLVGGALLVGAFAGFVVGAAVTNSRLGKEFDDRLSAELLEMKAFYQNSHKIADNGETILPGELPSIDGEIVQEEEKAEYENIIETSGYRPVDNVPVTDYAAISGADIPQDENPGTAAQNVFSKYEAVTEVEDYEGFDYEAQLDRQSGETPYLLTEDEFLENESSFEQISVTYYAHDDVLVGSDDEIIEPHLHDLFIGAKNFLKFGQGARSKNVVHVRNPDLETDFEVTKVDANYSKSVLGFDDGDGENFLRHSSHRPRGRRILDE